MRQLSIRILLYSKILYDKDRLALEVNYIIEDINIKYALINNIKINLFSHNIKKNFKYIFPCL